MAAIEGTPGTFNLNKNAALGAVRGSYEALIAGLVSKYGDRIRAGEFHGWVKDGKGDHLGIGDLEKVLKDDDLKEHPIITDPAASVLVLAVSPQSDLVVEREFECDGPTAWAFYGVRALTVPLAIGCVALDTVARALGIGRFKRLHRRFGTSCAGHALLSECDYPLERARKEVA